MSAIETYVDRESGESLSVASGTSLALLPAHLNFRRTDELVLQTSFKSSSTMDGS